MLKIKVFDFTGKHAVTWSDGEKIHCMIKECLLAKTPVKLDFAGVQLVNVTFFNGSLAPLTKFLSPAEIMASLTIIGLPNPHLEALPMKVLEREYKFHTDPEFRDSVNEAVAKSMRNTDDI